MPRTCYGMQMVHLDGDLYAIGGADSILFQLYRSEIHKLSCRYGDCQWTKIKQELKMGRSQGVAIQVTDSLADCKGANWMDPMGLDKTIRVRKPNNFLEIQ